MLGIQEEEIQCVAICVQGRRFDAFPARAFQVVEATRGERPAMFPVEETQMRQVCEVEARGPRAEGGAGGCGGDGKRSR